MGVAIGDYRRRRFGQTQQLHRRLKPSAAGGRHAAQPGFRQPRFAQGLQVTIAALRNKRLIVIFAQQRYTLVPLANQMAGCAVRSRLVIEIKLGIGLWQTAAPQGEKRKAGREQLNQARIIVQGMGNNQRINTTTLHHTHITVFIGLFVIGYQQ